MRFLEKVIVSMLSALILSLYFVVIEQRADGSYFFLNLFVVYFVYSFPIYLIGGGYSYFVDIYFDGIQFRNKFLKYLIGLLIYIAGGFLVIGILLLVLLFVDGGIVGLSPLSFLVVGVLASLLFYHLSLFSKKTLKSILY